MEHLRDLLGESLYDRVIKKLNGRKLVFSDGKEIPKYRFDEVNNQLKEQKAKVIELRAMLDAQNLITIKQIENVKIETQIFKLIAKSKPKNFDAILSLVKSDSLNFQNVTSSVSRQIRKIKKQMPSLFL